MQLCPLTGMPVFALVFAVVHGVYAGAAVCTYTALPVYAFQRNGEGGEAAMKDIQRAAWSVSALIE